MGKKKGSCPVRAPFSSDLRVLRALCVNQLAFPAALARMIHHNRSGDGDAVTDWFGRTEV